MQRAPSPRQSFSGYFLAGAVLLGLNGLLAFLVLPLGLAFFFLLAGPALIHSAILIAAQADRLPLPWEDQFAAVVVSFVIQFPLWFAAGFAGFLTGSLLFTKAPIDGGSGDLMGEIYSFWSLFGLSTLMSYLVLFVITIVLLQGSMYRDNPKRKTLSLRDSMPIHPPM